jgi:uncharacterized glyoxalase superfamily protein PhnB
MALSAGAVAEPRDEGENRMLVGAATIFTVRDLAASVAYYRDTMGFTVTFQYGEPAFYACLCRDEVAIHLRAGVRWTPGNGAIAIFVNDVDALHGELVARGANVLNPPQDYPYGMRDFDVADPDGNHLTFGMETQSAVAAASN